MFDRLWNVLSGMLCDSLCLLEPTLAGIVLVTVSDGLDPDRGSGTVTIWEYCVVLRIRRDTYRRVAQVADCSSKLWLISRSIPYVSLPPQSDKVKVEIKSANWSHQSKRKIYILPSKHWAYDNWRQNRFEKNRRTAFHKTNWFAENINWLDFFAL